MIAFRQIAARLAAGKEPLAEPEDPMLGGVPVAAWFDVFSGTHVPGMSGFVRTEWPEPGGYADQPTIAVAALAAVGEAWSAEAESQAARSARG